MNPSRFKILLGAATVLLAMCIWNWIAGWGLVTVHVQGQPLSKVIRSIERQGGITLITNADMTAPITMDVNRVPPVEAVDVLAARLDGNWSVGYVAGPSKADLAAGITGITQGERDRDFRSFGFGGFGGGGGMIEFANTPVDARLIAWKVSPSDTPDLQSYLNQLSQKTGLMAMVPRDWNPAISGTPKGGKAATALRDIVKSVKGQSREIFIIRVWARDRVADNQQPPERAARTEGNFNGQRPGGDRGGSRGDFHPEWMAERAEARIALLPPEERAQAKKDFDDMRAMWEPIRALPEAQRRAAMQKLFNNPTVQERMAERMDSRDRKAGPERRAARARRYIQRKQQMQAKTSS